MIKDRVPWNRFLVESFVIIASILLALAADAWLEERNRREDEAQLLGSLQTELLQVREGLNNFVQQIESQGDRIFEIALAMESATPENTPIEEIARGAAGYGPPPDYSVPRAVLNSIMNGGELSLIDSGPLKISIADYEQGIARLGETQVLLDDIWISYQAPYRYQNMSMRGEPTEMVKEAYAGNRYYSNILRARISRGNDVIERVEELQHKVDTTLELIALEIE